MTIPRLTVPSRKTTSDNHYQDETAADIATMMKQGLLSRHAATLVDLLGVNPEARQRTLRKLVETKTCPTGEQNMRSVISPKQCEVLSLLSESNRSTEDVAGLLQKSPRTVRDLAASGLAAIRRFNS